MTVIYHREAEAELIQAAQYYESKVPGLGADFLDEIDAAVQRIQKDPDALPVVEDDIRRCPVKRFPYCLYYRVVIDVIRVLVAKHHSRHPDYWKGRR